MMIYVVRDGVGLGERSYDRGNVRSIYIEKVSLSENLDENV